MHSEPTAGLMERLAAGPVVCAEGYLFELERRGYLQAGAFVPEVVLDHPDKVAELHREFVHAGSDVVEAFTYYAHREKLRLIGKEDRLEQLNSGALRIARDVARETSSLFAGNICNTNVFEPDNPSVADQVRAMFTEQVGWAAEAGADFIIGETFSYAAEALIALEVIREAGLPAVVTLAFHKAPETRDGWTAAEAGRRLAGAGADVVGLNCIRGPRTMLPLLEQLVPAVDVPVAALPVPYRTHAAEPSFQSLRDPAYDHGSDRPFPVALDPFTCNRHEIADFTRAAAELGVRYFGVCCGAGPHHIRAMAEALARTPAASRYSADMSQHAFLGSDPSLRKDNLAYGVEY
ncbi:MAG TPA: homocysteine S-methyltransferase family protein [Actinomycetales bacterium]|nr:homocysteine S-methyltransferase family protein [Actinomycetales bacterium]